ncbi:MAG TPA: hypothetical protein DDZ83_18860 [Nitrospinae bacterium]|nr:hypothetical protein [Nitrospinota bacterium]
MTDVNERRRHGREMAERISQLLSQDIPGFEHNIRFNYVDDSFRLWWGERGDPDTTLLITFDQLRTLNDDELRQIIRNTDKNS